MLRMFKSKPTQFNCFSPPVMLATMIVESCLALYTLWRYKMTPVTRLIAIILLALGTFQLAEYFVCTGYGFRAEQWSRLGYVAISTLPVLGLHLQHLLANKRRRRLVVTAYVTLVACIIYFFTYSTAFIGYKCTGNYVIFQIGARAAIVYGWYYYGWLLAAIILGMNWANELKRQGKEASPKLQSVRALIVGYLIFLVPTALANSVDPETRKGIPSIMCGFAVLFALILVLYVLPRRGQLRCDKTEQSTS